MKHKECVLDAPAYNEKLTGLLGVILGFLLVVVSYNSYRSALSYRPPPQQVFLDIYNRPIGTQSLLLPTHHNPGLRKTTSERNGETATDFVHLAIVDMFNYNSAQLDNGEVFDKFQTYLSERIAVKIYRDIFLKLSQQRIVKAQEGVVRSRVVGELEISNPRNLPYQTTSGMTLEARTFRVNGTLLVTVHAEKEYPTIYTMSAIVQRALIQDKLMGYQIVSLELN
ncbi:hypothetical protein [Alteromonas sp. 14N.309.X.WAT.G.H12]|uniref:hypothetical protein n=1 Tax=Alteromonas sp. 14N.309.X.WAT.G.H12 TaxID=3120824 RepID=UPI002FD6C328